MEALSEVTKPQKQSKGEIEQPEGRTLSNSSAELYALINTILTDASLTAKEKQLLIDEVRKSTPASDRWTYRYAIYGLLAVVLLTVLGALFLQEKFPASVIAIGSAAVGGLAGMLGSVKRS